MRAQLAATAQGLSMHPLLQSLQEYPEQKPHYHAVHQLLGPSERWHTMQMWTRLSDGPAIGPSPRRGLKSHVRRASWAGGGGGFGPKIALQYKRRKRRQGSF
ncbi:hypothetical protein [Limnohabitans planktonicus]|uniref:Uncharacterized protein n=1 Tax=Limnohabitans planktonicus II-D5 TaxID=1293045 RepID=A0A2T7UHI9_9BURK|nr:hypothetical protein [Limnohabitans planktonicus]PVE44132.1 hypothetical protein H663_004060 [Limnohabitans planktonicus II-D5]